MQSFRFDNPYDTWWTETQLADLAVALSRTARLRVSYGLHSTLNVQTPELVISTFWEVLPEHERLLVQKADVYLRAVGNRKWTDWTVLQSAWQVAENLQFPQLARQLLCVAEDDRLSRRIVEERPGTNAALQARGSNYARLFHENRANRMRSHQLADVMLGDAYQALCSSGEEQTSVLLPSSGPSGPWTEHIALFLRSIRQSKATVQIVDAVFQFVEQIAREGLATHDASYDLFACAFGENLRQPVVPDTHPTEPQTPPRQQNQTTRDASTDDSERREEMEVWTQAQESNAPGALSMELNSEQSSPSAGVTARFADDKPTSLTVRRGQSDSGQYEDFGEADEETGLAAASTNKASAADDVGIKLVSREPISEVSRQKVSQWDHDTEAVRRKLRKQFHQMLLHRMQARNQNTRHGRLDKGLTRLVTQTHPRLFYHKSSKDKLFDAAIQLLVDCSGSMYQRLEAVKPMIYLFHETLRSLQIPHDVCGFWEDSIRLSANDVDKPVTHLQHVIEWQDGWQRNVSGYIDALTPGLDNRDGFAIRKVGEKLLARQEKQKWLLVISDGDPAAEDYRDAVLDTKNSIRSLVIHGVHVLHLCIAQADDALMVEALKQMYGSQCVVVPGIDELPNAMERAMSTMILPVR